MTRPVASPVPHRTRAAIGMTLVEVTVVMLIAALVMVGLIGFYLNAQTGWIDASMQALGQREATLVLETLGRDVRAASSAEAAISPPSLILRDFGGTETVRYELRPDSSLHRITPAGGDGGPMGSARITRFEVSTSESLVHLRALAVLSPRGGPTTLSTRWALYNRP
jgi:Tfp pilus assembly protein PilW